MNNPRLRPFLYAAMALVTIWLLTWAGYTIALHSKMTTEKLRAYVNSIDLSKLSPEERARAIHRLAAMLNALSMEERRNWRKDAEWKDWFAEMTEEEKGQFIEETMPTGFKQMLDAFSQLPDTKRKKVIDDALKNLKDAENNDGGGQGGGPNTGNAVVGGNKNSGTNSPPLSPELEQKVRAIGLNTFYSQSSAETKAELAPLVEELQHQVQSGRGFH